ESNADHDIRPTDLHRASPLHADSQEIVLLPCLTLLSRTATAVLRDRNKMTARSLHNAAALHRAFCFLRSYWRACSPDQDIMLLLLRSAQPTRGLQKTLTFPYCDV